MMNKLFKKFNHNFNLLVKLQAQPVQTLIIQKMIEECLAEKDRLEAEIISLDKFLEQYDETHILCEEPVYNDYRRPRKTNYKYCAEWSQYLEEHETLGEYR